MNDPELKLYFDDICDLFVELGSQNPPAELHGMLTGQLCAGLRMSPEVWIAKAMEFIDSNQQPGAAAQRELVEIYQVTYAQLEDADNIFYPLLPDDDEELAGRIRSIGHWCEGFLAGFALVERSSAAQQLPPVVSDALKDLADITKAGADADEEPDEESENDYIAIVEYVRLLALNIYLECGVVEENPKAAVATTPQQLFDKPLH